MAKDFLDNFLLLSFDERNNPHPSAFAEGMLLAAVRAL